MKLQIRTDKAVKSCYNECDFFRSTNDGMSCNHPHFKNCSPYSNMIISQQNSRGKLPEKCPLRQEELQIITNYIAAK